MSPGNGLAKDTVIVHRAKNIDLNKHTTDSNLMSPGNGLAKDTVTVHRAKNIDLNTFRTINRCTLQL